MGVRNLVLKIILLSGLGGIFFSPSLYAERDVRGEDILPPVAVLDQEYILFECQAAQEIRALIESKRQLFQSEIDEQEKALRQEEESLQSAQQTMSEEAFLEKRAAFEKRVDEVHRAVSSRRSQLEKFFNKAREEIITKMNEIMTRLSQEKNLELVFPKGAVLYAKKNLDITQDVLEELNRRLPQVAREILQDEKSDD